MSRLHNMAHMMRRRNRPAARLRRCRAADRRQGKRRRAARACARCRGRGAILLRLSLLLVVMRMMVVVVLLLLLVHDLVMVDRPRRRALRRAVGRRGGSSSGHRRAIRAMRSGRVRWVVCRRLTLGVMVVLLRGRLLLGLVLMMVLVLVLVLVLMRVLVLVLMLMLLLLLALVPRCVRVVSRKSVPVLRPGHWRYRMVRFGLVRPSGRPSHRRLRVTSVRRTFASRRMTALRTPGHP